MPTNNIPEFILLSKIVNKLRDKEYYRTYAKTFIMTNLPDMPLPAEENLVKEMFRYFVESNTLQIHFNDAEVHADALQQEAERRAGLIESKTDQYNDLVKNELECIWESEIYINAKGLKKLYADKCIVFPNSLLKD